MPVRVNKNFSSSKMVRAMPGITAGMPNRITDVSRRVGTNADRLIQKAEKRAVNAAHTGGMR